MRTRVKGMIACLVIALAACDSAPDKPDRAPPPPPGPRPSGAPAGSAAAAPGATVSAAGSAAAPAADGAGLAGQWEGHYDAKKGSVLLPPKVKDKGLAQDDGKKSAGPGTIELTISPEGEVHGKGKGALGALTLSGKVDGNVVRASVFPDDPHAGDAMTGVLVGPVKDGVINAELRVAGRDATIVRESAIELKKK